MRNTRDTRALRVPDFRRLLAADSAAQLGGAVSTVAIPLVAVIALDATAVQTGLLVAAERAAFLILSLPAGALADRLPRRPMMITADLTRAALLATVPLAWWLDGLTLAHLYTVAFGTGAATVFFDLAYQSLLPTIVGRQLLMDGNSKLEAVRSGSEVAGPVVGGWAVQLVGAPATVIGSALGHLGSALWLARIRTPEPPRRPSGPHEDRGGMTEEIREGFRFVLSHPILRAVLACMTLANFSASMLLAVQTIFLVRVVGVTPGLYGTLLAAGALGGLAAVAAVGRAAALVGSARLIWVALLVAAPGALLIPLTAPGWRVSLFAAGIFIDAFGVVLYSISQVSYRQAVTPDHLLGRMNATLRTVAFGALPLGGLAGGLLGHSTGVHTTVWIASIGSALSVVPLLLSPLRRLRDLPAAAPPATDRSPQ
ncbi:MFS transporter [Actinocorallia sp. B10E7]|uniref:MFS transporter n=1 Tax=Actinocorallia sp. B10E7 TaxID=3153558 RepID=UPI00325EEC41